MLVEAVGSTTKEVQEGLVLVAVQRQIVVAVVAVVAVLVAV